MTRETRQNLRLALLGLAILVGLTLHGASRDARHSACATCAEAVSNG